MDEAGDDTCGLYIDLPLGARAVAPGDWIATEAGSRYLVTSSRKVNSRRHAQQDRYQLRCQRLPKHQQVPDDVEVVWLRWYSRNRR